MTLRRLFICIIAVPMALFLLAAGSAVSGTLKDSTARAANEEQAKRQRLLAYVAATLADQEVNATEIPKRLLDADPSLLAVSWQPDGDSPATTAGESAALADTLAREVPSARFPNATLKLAYAPHDYSQPLLWRLPAAGISLLVMTIALALALAQFVEHLLSLFTGMVRQLERNNYKATLAPPLTKESALLADHLNRLAETLRDRGRISRGYLAALRQKNQQLERQIAEREKIEEALAEEKARLQVTLSSLAEGVLATDTDGLVVLASDAACTLTGWPRDEIIGKPLGEVFQLQSLLSDGERIAAGRPNRCVLTCRDDSTRLVAESTAPICEASGEVSGSVVVFAT